MYIPARSQPTAACAPSRESCIPFAPDVREGTIVRSVRVKFTDAQQEVEVIDQDSTIICDGPPHGVCILGKDVVGEFVRVLIEGGAWWKCPGLCGHQKDAIPALGTGRPGVLTPDGPKTRTYDFNALPYRRHAHYPHHSHSHGTSTESAYDDCGRGWSTTIEEDKRQWVSRPVWEETGMKLDRIFAEEVATGRTYLEITSVDRVEDSGLVVDGGRIEGMQEGIHVPLR